ncbi:hypothetical protein FGO68_gene17402 [Halteria grandinella]|uniref:Tyrosine specific protein phosphatases domain-containing protein n=1 Tax=Halteria grandinella TaxID=5974 RepID=A0A8J8T2M4_HALGN|nr:hypothetical protein FGO68_gene17402 [Halteria grandinella]
MINKADESFVGGLFFSKIGDTGIYIGPYPQTQDDVEALFQAGITGVLNVQTEDDFMQRSIDWSKMQAYYKGRNIQPECCPVQDLEKPDVDLNLSLGAKKLDEMLKRKLKVYVHCTTGMDRAPAVVLTYLSIFYDMDPNIADQFVKSHRSVSQPDLAAVKRAVSNGKRGVYNE